MKRGFVGQCEELGIFCEAIGHREFVGELVVALYVLSLRRLPVYLRPRDDPAPCPPRWVAMTGGVVWAANPDRVIAAARAWLGTPCQDQAASWASAATASASRAASGVSWSDLRVGLSPLGKWIRTIFEESRVPERDADLFRENERLRNESRILWDLSRITKQSGGLFPGESGRC